MFTTGGVALKTFCVGITGASGGVYALRLARALLEGGHAVRLVATKAGEQVLAHETGVRLAEFARGWEHAALEDDGDLFSPIASGSFPLDGMAVAPCSMATLGRLASGASTDLLTRAADVTLAERRRLVIVPRETPLSAIHLGNMLALARAGAVILPAMPGFYHRPGTVDDLVGFVAGKILDSLGVENALYEHWKGIETVEEDEKGL